MCSELKAGNFTTLVYSILLKVGKSALKMKETLWRNSLILAKDVGIICVNFIATAVTFSQKKLETFTFYCPSYILFIIFAPYNSIFLKYTFYSIVLHFMFISLFHNKL
jgi:hypothetical protein